MDLLKNLYLLNSKLGVQEYVVNRAKKAKSALLRNAKIRLSNIHPGRLLMNLRGRDKWIKEYGRLSKKFY